MARPPTRPLHFGPSQGPRAECTSVLTTRAASYSRTRPTPATTNALTLKSVSSATGPAIGVSTSIRRSHRCTSCGCASTIASWMRSRWWTRIGTATDSTRRQSKYSFREKFYSVGHSTCLSSGSRKTQFLLFQATQGYGQTLIPRSGRCFVHFSARIWIY